jgi:hypothetical protein
MIESGLEQAVMTVGDAGAKRVWAKDALYRYYSNGGGFISVTHVPSRYQNFFEEKPQGRRNNDKPNHRKLVYCT